MKIDFNQNENYCIFIGGMQCGKSFIFNSMDSDSIHFNKKLRSNIINMLSSTTIYEHSNIIGLNKYLNALKPKLNGCYMLQNDFKMTVLKHTNDIIRNQDNPNAIRFEYIKKTTTTILHSYYFILGFIQDNEIQYNIKNILSLPPGEIDIEEFFKSEIQKYNLRPLEKTFLKMDYEWSYEKLKDEIQNNLLKYYNIKHVFKLNEYLNYIEETEYNVKKLYRIM